MLSSLFSEASCRLGGGEGKLPVFPITDFLPRERKGSRNSVLPP